MTRDLRSLTGHEFDLLVVGGGAFAACAAWEGVLRGYSVALVEANDFGSGTSANSFKMVHGGIRYLQHLDLPRLWSSCRERSALLRIAPHLVKPLPIALPTYGHGRSGKGFLGAGFLAYDALTPGRNRGIADATRHIPLSSFMSRREVLERFPEVAPERLTGAAVFNDAQMYHPPRLVFAFIASAVARGAVASNYVRATSLVRQHGRVAGVLARDRLTGEALEIRSRVVINAAGPWSEGLLEESGGLRLPDAGVYSRDTCFIIDGAPEPVHALAVQGASVDKGQLIGRGARHLFVVPWRGRRLVGVWHVVFRKGADAVAVSEEELERFLLELNASSGSLRVERGDLKMVNAGLVPFGDSDETGQTLEFGKRSHLVDSATEHGVEGLVTLIGVRHTMARGDAVRALDIVDGKLGRKAPPPDSSAIPLLGGDVDDFGGVVADVQDALTGSDSQDLAPELAALHGSRALQLVAAGRRTDGLGRIRGADIIGAQIEAAVRDEMAVTLGDLVFRRTPLAAGGNPGEDVLAECARQMGQKLGWTDERKRREIDAVLARFPTDRSAGRIPEPDVEAMVGVTTDRRAGAACL